MESEILQVHRMTPNQTQGIGYQTFPTYMHCSTPSLTFSSVSLYDQPFFHILGFPLISMLKFQSDTFFFNFWQIVKKYPWFVFPYDCRIYHKVWPGSNENCTRSSVLKFPAPYGSVLTKMWKCESLSDRQKQSQSKFPRDQKKYNNIWLKLNEK